MPPAMSIAEAHAIGEQVEKALRTRLAALERVVIRVGKSALVGSKPPRMSEPVGANLIRSD